MWNQKKTDNIIIVTALSLLIVFSYLLYDDSFLFSNSDKDQSEAIGNVESVQNDVRKKNSGTFSWLPSQNKEFVFQNDSLFTGENSEADIKLKDGSVISIKENSLVTLTSRNGEMQLDLKFGNFQGNLTQNANLKIKADGEEYQVKGNKEKQSKIQITKNRSGNVKVKVLTGTAELSSKSTGKKTLKKDENVAIEKGKVKELPKPKLELITKENINFNKFIKEDTFNLEWKGKEIARYQVAIFNQESSDNPLFSKNIKEQLVTITNPLDAGVYFWQVKGFDGAGNLIIESAKRSFSISVFKSPYITKPELNSTFSQELTIRKTDELKIPIEIEWDSDSRIKSYEYELAADKQFNNTIEKNKTEKMKIKTKTSLMNGTYFVRVRGEYNNRITNWSSPQEFQINLIAKEEQRPPSPTLVQRRIHFTAPLSIPHTRDPASLPAPEIRWQKVPDSVQYKVQLSEDLDFKKPIALDSIKDGIKWQNYEPGKYYFRVFSKAQNGLYSYPSQIGLLKIQMEKPVIEQVKDIKIKETDPTANPPLQNVNIHWTPVPFAKKYQVQINDTDDFKNAQNIETTIPSASLPVSKPGKYFVRVQALKENNDSISEYSSPTTMSYSFTTIVGTPELNEPLNQTTLFLQQDMPPFVWLVWNPVKYASKYKIEISTAPDFSNIIISEYTNTSKYLVNKKVPYGKLYWRVSANSEFLKASSDWSSIREFDVFQQKNEFYIK